ncbi:NADPH-dependent 7-cyano-7-deazaguanine reductase [Tepidimonas alkaliphilus]|uniref:NADPH-dependent 7-cyano-7-deazaguanine reductase n=1 Tax=Tepidimonas alkaliphilus TaxID=2588942 RepID=A0A554W6S8_9BURK|nr:NADPH-dependent 7-cyano-7-deazaguanine reductase QueF [Tepidimonas alkaliphilus]TSE19283.1 NADPH-dependent 7-cyano-7-deazaguanine reductase [Tepidimonas alkaliphilus]
MQEAEGGAPAAWLHTTPLGQSSAYPDRYDPGLLCPLPRAAARQALALQGLPPFTGADVWTAYEVSWLNPRGKPQVAMAQFTIPAETPNLIESKSLKLYLNSLNHERMASLEEVRARLRADLTEALWRGSEQPPGHIGVQLWTPAQWGGELHGALPGLSLDRLDVECTHDEPDTALLRADATQPPVQEVLTSDLFRSLCPVTGQPDWASVQIAYTGAPIDQEGLLRYLVGFRRHAGFHEQCVERIFVDLWRRCQPVRLAVLARFTRRGGLDINPWRTSHPQPLPAALRLARQ